MAVDPSARSEGKPLTISQWREIQGTASEPTHILTLIEEQAQSNTSNAWISLARPAQIIEQWEKIIALRSQGVDLPLFGVPFAAKDNIDAAGFCTTAACPSFGTKPVAADSTIVRRLKSLGAILVGKTNLDQFATGLVGTRSPYGAVANSFDPSRVSGGSSSGSSVVVAQGLVPFSLGTDTAGSGRIPAGFNNIVGLKPTRGALSTHGVVPACRSLDCVSIFALTLEDADEVLRLAEGFDVLDAYSRDRSGCATKTSPRGALPPQPTLAICADPQWFGHTEQAVAYEAALAKGERLGWKLKQVDFTPLFALATLLYEGPWVAERYAAIQNFIQSAPADAMDPVVRGIIMKAEQFTAADVFDNEYRRQDLAREIEQIFGKYDALLVPTAPTFPTMQDLKDEPVLTNSQLGMYTNFVNFLDWSALAIPAGWRKDGLPFGITLIGGAWEEPRLMELARRWMSDSPRTLGATGRTYQEPPRSLPDEVSSIPVAVVGAHLTGFPLNNDLTSRGATLVASTATAPKYQLFSLNTTGPVRKPGLKRVVDGGDSIEVEVWSMPLDKMGSFLGTIVAPLGLGSIELENGHWVQGFICEPIGLADAENITNFGGWRAYMKSLQTTTPAPSHKTPSVPFEVDEVKAIKRVLIANRGEIALRIIRTLRDMNISSVSIYSSADARAPHVTAADTAFPLTGDTVSDTYLNGKQILDIAKEAGADAVIPGYGFLSENSDFAAAVEAAGLIWIGPTPKQMSDLGLKHSAREIAIAAGIPVVPGSQGLVTNIDDALADAEKIGYPIMVKSTAGGGGIGLQRCADAHALREAFDGVRRLGQANFGDDGVFIEHFIDRARHVEVQVLGDGSGRVICAGDRDCSLQRRNQKVVEEAPAAFVPIEIQADMRRAAAALVASLKYRNVGTVEFIFDIDVNKFYFLEMNTRLQVEHPVTEAVTGLDLVQCMMRIAMNDCAALFPQQVNETPTRGAAVEARVYAESPLQGFRPSPGKLLNVQFPSDVRVDTWVSSGQEVSSSFDPMIAKIIAYGEDRREALHKVSKALAKTTITGIETNLEYLRQIVDWDLFHSGEFTTTSLNAFPFNAQVLEVIDVGSGTSVQDFPGRQGLWHIGIPPSGPMDSYSFRLANRILGNGDDAAGLECSIQGLKLLFHCPTTIAVVGSDAPLYVDGKQVDSGVPIKIKAKQELTIGTSNNGSRVYLAVRGGLQVPKVLGSRSTFAIGHFGGYNGRILHIGDLLPIESNDQEELSVALKAPALPLPTSDNREWIVAAVPGPHGGPIHFTQKALLELFNGVWTVHYNSNRLGVRLTGPRPKWTRKTGGDAGLHPSNIHDSPYSIGNISFTGDEAVVLTADGPSLGGFVSFATIVDAEMWKFGQMLPGDRVRLRSVSLHDALELSKAVEQSIAELSPLAAQAYQEASVSTLIDPVVKEIRHAGRFIRCCQSGDRALLLEFGEEDDFTLRQTFHVMTFMEKHRKYPMTGVRELTPGVRSIHVRVDENMPLDQVLDALVAHESSLGTEIPSRLPSRIVKMPLAFDDEKSRKAIARYSSTIRSSAPYLHSNIEFLQKLNGLDSVNEVETTLYDGTFLVLGLGDVYLGSPCAIPLDPRHRLFGTKYNPSRSFTPRGAVGIAGQYLCIYATDSPGGYQLVGRTVPIWEDFHGSELNGEVPWMFSLLDQIQFYPIAEDELSAAERNGTAVDLINISNTTLDLEDYERWLKENEEDIIAVREQRMNAVHKADFYEDLLKPYELTVNGANSRLGSDESVPGERVKARLPGRCFRCAVEEGDEVRSGQPLIWIESNKMEVKICAPKDGKCVRLLVGEGDVLGSNDDIAIIS
ncbi:urea amidolyase [Aaosphaeria arxii CBS 175.79]|uniref:Urea amidolyase n=1 Tax=Aaosphaeria arxii CBS 175.79 TaxID=1450172 RepID=A0A6A5XIB7_9PLEO|nr:urea amidolyase [Aaosphaeria arxii CBS 175.79]KAF2012988.1 urea amidolyase [Aaosphaeria arxii CBS 175.79]